MVSGNPKDRSLDNQSGRIAEEARVVSIHRAETATSFLIDACVQIQALQLRFRYSTRTMNKPGVPMQRLLDEPCTRVDFSVEGSNGLQPAVRLLHVAIYGRGTTPSENKIPMVVEDEEDDEQGGGKQDGEQPISEDGDADGNDDDADGEGDEEEEEGTIGDAGEGDLVSLSANMDALAFLCQVLGVDEDPQAMIAFLMSFPFVDDAWDVPEIVLGAICDDEEDGEDGEWEDIDDEEEDEDEGEAA